VKQMSKELEKLEKILGKNRVITNSTILKLYSSDKSSFELGKTPLCILMPKNTIEIQKIIEFSSKYRIPLTPSSSGIHFYGRTFPTDGGIIVDLSEMNRIIKFDDRNKNATIEPGVTFSQLESIKAYGLMPLFPFCVPETKSVLTSYLEREPLLVPKLEYSEPILTMEVVLPTGEILRTGSAALKPSNFAEYVVPFGPGLNWNQFFQGAQGTLGIVTSATIKIEHIPKLDKIYFLSSSNVEDLIEPLYEIQRYLLGYECLILNDLNLAMILTRNKSDIERLRQKFSRWTLIVCLSGGVKLSEEKMKQEEEDFLEIIEGFKTKPSTTLAGFEEKILPILRESYKGEYWKLKRGGDFQDILFITRLGKVFNFVREVDETSSEIGYPPEEISCYIQPLVRGGACHMEFTLFYDSSNDRRKQIVKKTYEKLIESLFDMGAFFSRPYGSYLSDITYGRNPVYTRVLKEIKELFDPSNIMNPEKLCFKEG
ncbi:MAG: FAD-binding oxidoreductase, partial [Candidatus Jordarchaeum sp.]|uniref:FAD-binding oxidoreductase n=1 Tax=Candidatus Jordarchaeum sp. TaxID=2823881 RepID=UPI00404B8D38